MMSRSLRSWQSNCITMALSTSPSRRTSFQATPGAGKTRMAAEMASQLLKQDRIDLVLCLPSCQVVEVSFDLAKVLGRRLDGQIGAVAAYTYQAMEYRDEGSGSFWMTIGYSWFSMRYTIVPAAILYSAMPGAADTTMDRIVPFTLALTGHPGARTIRALLRLASSPRGI